VVKNMLMVLTGKPGSGKTTSVEKIAERFGGVGFITREVRKNGRRVGFVIETSWKERLWLARADHDSKFRVGKYGVFVENVDRVSEKLLSLLNVSQIVYVDEVGKMEMKSEKFQHLVEEILKSNITSILTIPVVDFHPLVKKIRKSADVIINTGDYWNKREELVDFILGVIKSPRR
jgi:nucleoside-triphosphatase